MEKRYDHKQLEQETQDFWKKEETYSVKNNPGKLYSIDTPPPTVSGSLHIGHIFSYTQTDIIARYRRMSGFSVFYPFGFDDNGLPTERYVEKKLKIRAHELQRSELIKTCLEVTKDVELEFKNLWQSIGLSVDWSICYETISDSSRKIAQESFIELYKKGYIYRRDEPALYCTTCRTSVAQAELDDEEEKSFFNDIIFKTKDGKDLIVGTTRPELLYSVVALLYNPNDSRYKHLKNKKAIAPVVNIEIPIYEDDLVEIEKGTGLVMVCTFGDTTDIEWYKKFKLPYNRSIGFDGKMLSHTGSLAGLKVKIAREKILEELKEKKLLVGQKEITHSVNLHERCKKPVEIIALPQWFLKIIDYKEKFLEQADKINWYPTYMKARYRDWVENLKWDWCLSRQRFYGVPFPVWHCSDCGEILLASVEHLPIDPQETAFPGKGCFKCGGSNITPDTDVMDTWNISSLTPQLLYSYFNKGTESPFTDKKISEFIPMSMRPQAHDIIRTWAFYTIVKTWMHHNTIPWKNIVISGHVLSNSKTKLSKSKGNAKLSPQHLLQQYSADAIRYWTASGSLGKDISFSETQIKIGQKLITKLWNAFRFINMHLEGQSIEFVDPKDSGSVNQWILDSVSDCFKNYKKHFEQNEFNLALQQIEKFFWSQFCDNYLELVKDLLFNPEKYDQKLVAATRYTLKAVGFRILQMYAPFQPHVTESIYQQLYKKDIEIGSLHQTKYDFIQKEYENKDSVKDIEFILNIISKVRKLKSENSLSLATGLNNVIIYFKDKNKEEVIKSHRTLLLGATRAYAIDYRCEAIEKDELFIDGDKQSVKIIVD